jgi:hypothetical protein
MRLRINTTLDDASKSSCPKAAHSELNMKNQRTLESSECVCIQKIIIKLLAIPPSATSLAIHAGVAYCICILGASRARLSNLRVQSFLYSSWHIYICACGNPCFAIYMDFAIRASDVPGLITIVDVLTVLG